MMISRVIRYASTGATVCDGPDMLVVGSDLSHYLTHTAVTVAGDPDRVVGDGAFAIG